MSNSFEIALPKGLTAGGSLRPCRIVSHTATEARFSVHLTQEQWLEYGQVMRNFMTSLPYYLADWMKVGQQRWGLEVVKSAIEQLDLPMDSVESSSQIAALGNVRRRMELSPQHHETVGIHVSNGRIVAAEAQKWLELAVEHGLSEGELNNSIVEGKIVRRVVVGTKGSNRTGFVSVHGFGLKFRRWEQNLGGREAILDMPSATQSEILNEIKPIGELYLAMKEKVKV